MTEQKNILMEQVDILLIEDSEYDRELTLRALKKNHIATHVHCLPDGTEAMDFLQGEGTYKGRPPVRPKLILLDLKMPKVNGLEVLRELKLKPATRKIPVVILTSSQESPDIQTSYELGANSYLVKPVSFSGFMESVARAGLYWTVDNQPPE